MHPRVAYVTHAGSAAHPDLDMALPAIEAAGLDPEVHAWDSPIEWDRFDLVLVRSAWDHARRRPDFLRWARWVEDHTRLANPAVTLARNTDRTYLRDLRKEGLPVVETIWLEPGEDPALCQAQIEERGWDRCVVRPHIGTGSDGLEVIHGVASVARAAGSLAEGGAVAMVQPAPRIEDPATTMSVVVLDGHISHGVVTDNVHGQSGPEPAADLDDAITDVVSAVYDSARAGEQLLYARVDLVNDGDEWLLWGFEATDPCLFLGAAPGSAALLGHAVREWIMPEAQAADFLVGSG